MLMKDSVVFASLMDEYGRLEQQADRKGSRKPQAKVVAESNVDTSSKAIDATLMQTEERNTGAVSWDVYKKYMKYAGGVGWAPIIIGLLLLGEAARGVWCLLPKFFNLHFMLAVGNNLFLGFWTSNSVHGFSQGDYMAVYAGLGAVASVAEQFIRLDCTVQVLQTPCFHFF
jgi:ATP-binding cassette, subfamily C (CFTR/MRP), member 1